MTRLVRFIAVICLSTSFFISGALAVNPDEVLDDPALEARARALSAELRCMVCQNQSIDDSDAELAKDLRVLVRKRLVEGDSDVEVIDFVVSRYGDFVLLKPRFSAKNFVLWATPVFVLLIGALLLVINFRPIQQRPIGAELSKEEKEKLNQILKD